MPDERKFLHDIASPLTTVQLNLESVVMILEDKKPEELPQALELLRRCVEQTRRAGTMVQARRQIIITRENK